MQRHRTHPEEHFLNPPVFAVPHTSSRAPNHKPHQSARKFHLRRLNDIMHLCLQRRDYARAKAAFSILMRCRDVDCMDLWKTGLALVAVAPEGNASTSSLLSGPGHAKVLYLKTVIMNSTTARVEAVKELLLLWISMGEYSLAKEYLSDDYLPAYPLYDSTILRVYGGLISLHLAAQLGSSQSSFSQRPASQKSSVNLNANHLRTAKDHFEQALRLDPSNAVALEFYEKLKPQFAIHGLKLGDIRPPKPTTKSKKKPEKDSTAPVPASPVAQPESEEDDAVPAWALSSDEDDGGPDVRLGGDDGDSDVDMEEIGASKLNFERMAPPPPSSRSQMRKRRMSTFTATDGSEGESEVNPAPAVSSRPGRTTRSQTATPNLDLHPIPSPAISLSALSLTHHSNPPTPLSQTPNRTPDRSPPAKHRRVLRSSSRRTSFADLNALASPEMELDVNDDDVYVDEEAMYHGRSSP